MDVLRKVYYAISKDNLHSRREIAESLGISVVTVGKAIESLTAKGIIKNCGKISGGLGRKSDFIEISNENKVLLINLFENRFSYSLSPMSSDHIDIISFPYVDSLDFTDNLLMFSSFLRDRLPCDLLKTIISIPGEYENGRITNTVLGDYSGADLRDIFGNFISDDTIFISSASAIKRSISFGDDDVYVSLEATPWGTFGKNNLQNFSNIPVESKFNLTISEAMKTSFVDNKNILRYVLHFLRVLDGVLSPDRILFASYFDEELIDEINIQIPKLISVKSDDLIYDGLMEIAIDRIIG